MVVTARQMAVPFAIDTAGRVSFVTDPNQQLIDRIVQVIGTNPGERVMLPEFGVALQETLFAPMDSETGVLLGTIIQAALTQWEPSAALIGVTPTVLDALTGEIDVEVSFSTQLPEAIGGAAVQSIFFSVGGNQ